MPSQTIPLVGTPNQRGIRAQTALAAGKDQIFSSVFITAQDNPLTNSRALYAEKRPGWTVQSTPAAGSKGDCIFVGTYNVRAFGGSPSSVYVNNTLVGVTDTGNTAREITEAIIGGEVVVLISGEGGYFIPTGALQGAATFSGDRTSGSPVLANVTVTDEFYIGQALSGTGIPAGTRILSYDVGTSTVTMTANATSGAATSTTVTRSIMAKIIDPDFLGTVGGFVEMDGYVFTVTALQDKVQHSDLNSITSWSASSVIEANSNTDTLICVKKQRDRILAFGQKSIEPFYNAGNPSGSVLSRVQGGVISIGVLYSRAVTSLQDTLFFHAAGSGPQSGVWQLDGGGLKKISSPAIDKLANSDLTTDMAAFMIGGQSLVFLSQGDTTSIILSQIYDVSTGIWTNSGFPFQFRISMIGDSLWAVALNSTSGSVYQLDVNSPVYQDNGVAYTMTIQTTKVNMGTENLKTYQKVSLIGSDIQASGAATLEYSDDDYATWATAGTFDLTMNQPVIHRVKAHRGGRAWRLTHSANTAFRAQALKFDYTEGKH